jgi:hypothetical protein
MTIGDRRTGSREDLAAAAAQAYVILQQDQTLENERRILT